MANPTLQIIIASTRPGRVGPSVAAWFRDRAIKAGSFEVELIDLAEVNLPMFDEPKHPAFRRVRAPAHQGLERDHPGAATLMSSSVPEYNYGFNAAIKNAIDYLNKEWQYKPLGFVSYGGVAAGTRAVQMLKQVVSALKMVPMADAVHIPFVQQFLDERAGAAAEPDHGGRGDRVAGRTGPVDRPDAADPRLASQRRRGIGG